MEEGRASLVGPGRGPTGTVLGKDAPRSLKEPDWTRDNQGARKEELVTRSI